MRAMPRRELLDDGRQLPDVWLVGSIASEGSLQILRLDQDLLARSIKVRERIGRDRLCEVVDGQRQITAIDMKNTKVTYTIFKGGATAEPKAPAKEDDFDDEQQPRQGGGAGGAPGGAGGGGPSLLTRSGRSGTGVVRARARARCTHSHGGARRARESAT